MGVETGKQAVSPFSADIDRVIYDMNQTFNPLHKDFMLDYHVAGIRNGYVLMTIALPVGMTRVFASMLESLALFFRFMDNKTKSAKAQGKAVDPAEVERRAELQLNFHEMACSFFDGFINAGLDVKEAVKQTNAALKADRHPWANHEAVMRVLRSAGRFRTKRGRPQG